MTYLIAIFVYLFILTGIGIYKSRQVKTQEDFTVAGITKVGVVDRFHLPCSTAISGVPQTVALFVFQNAVATGQINPSRFFGELCQFRLLNHVDVLGDVGHRTPRLAVIATDAHLRDIFVERTADDHDRVFINKDR